MKRINLKTRHDASRHSASPLLGVITSLQEQVEWSLRVASLCVGLAVGIMSLVSMVKKMRRS
jgi:hypothetical protein